MIDIVINETTHFLLSDEQLRMLAKMAVPEFFMDSTLPAPDDISDLVRNTMKGLAVVPAGLGKPNVFQSLMFAVYGAAAPKVEKRADKLPYLWNAIIDYILKSTIGRSIAIEVHENGEGIYVIDEVRSIAVHRVPEEVHP